ncbi:3-keto-5-aminohexanoate cleavage protein [Mesorhizobium sp. BHbdii]
MAPNRGRRTKIDHPALPLKPHELAAAECLEPGAAMVHVHGRDGVWPASSRSGRIPRGHVCRPPGVATGW